jgi:putative ABC transport system permease protein
MGRTFGEGEDQLGRDHVVILSHDLWVRRFAADPAIVGRSVRLNREDYTVVGVMQKNFQLLGFMPQLWTPLALSTADQTTGARKDRSLYLFGRLKPGVTLGQVRAQFVSLAQRAAEDFPEVEKGWGAAARTLPDFVIYTFGIRKGLAIIMTAVGFVFGYGLCPRQTVRKSAVQTDLTKFSVRIKMEGRGYGFDSQSPAAARLYRDCRSGE